MNIQYVIDHTGYPTNVIMPLAWYQQITQESTFRPVEISSPIPLASPMEIFNLFTNIYEGWAAAEIDEVETIILNRQPFFKGKHIHHLDLTPFTQFFIIPPTLTFLLETFLC